MIKKMLIFPNLIIIIIIIKKLTLESGVLEVEDNWVGKAGGEPGNSI